MRISINYVKVCQENLTWAAEHGLDGARGERMFALDDKLVLVRGDQLDVHGVGSLAPAVVLLVGVVVCHV